VLLAWSHAANDVRETETCYFVRQYVAERANSVFY
jgi:hypothetical protein